MRFGIGACPKKQKITIKNLSCRPYITETSKLSTCNLDRSMTMPPPPQEFACHERVLFLVRDGVGWGRKLNLSKFRSSPRGISGENLNGRSVEIFDVELYISTEFTPLFDRAGPIYSRKFRILLRIIIIELSTSYNL